jgi:hypothetical protein
MSFLSEYILRLSLFFMASIILFYESVSISDYRQVSFYATLDRDLVLSLILSA